jgi:hypothetical protein
MAAMRSGAMPAKPGVHLCAVEHDPACRIYRGAGCNCVPDISVADALRGARS